MLESSEQEKYEGRGENEGDKTVLSIHFKGSTSVYKIYIHIHVHFAALSTVVKVEPA